MHDQLMGMIIVDHTLVFNHALDFNHSLIAHKNNQGERDMTGIEGPRLRLMKGKARPTEQHTPRSRSKYGRHGRSGKIHGAWSMCSQTCTKANQICSRIMKPIHG